MSTRHDTPPSQAPSPSFSHSSLGELAQQFDVHPNQITQWRSQLLEGATAVFGESAKAEAAPAIDVKVLHAKIGELTLANDLWNGPPLRRRIA